MGEDSEQSQLRRGFSEPSAEVFAGLADRFRVPIWIFNPDQIVVYANEQTTIFGDGNDLGASLDDFSQEVQQILRPLITDCLNSESSLGYEGWVTSNVRGKCYWKISVVALPDRLTGVVVNDWTGRKSAEDELDSSTKRFQQLFDSIAEGFCTISPEGFFEIVNPALERIMGVKSGTLAGQGHQAFFQAEGRAEEDIVHQVQSLGRNTTFELKVKRPDGELRDLYISAQPQYDKHGKFTGVLALVQDFTLIKQSQHRLKGSESLNRAFMNAIPDMIFLIDRSGKFLDYHANNPDDLLVDPDTIIGRTVFDILPPGLAKLKMEKIEEACESGEFLTYDYELTLGKRKRRFESRMCCTSKNETLSVIRDVTNRYQTEEQLKASLARHENLVDSLHDGVAVIDNNHIIVSVNNSLCRMLGCRREDLLGSSLLDYFDQPNEYLWIEKSASKRDEDDDLPQRTEVALLAKDGRTIVTDASSAPIAGEQFSFAIFTDISVQKLIEQELNVSEDEFRMVITASNDAIATIDEQGLVRVFNPAAERMFNRRFGAMFGQRLDCLVPENMRERHREFISSYFSTGKPDSAIGVTLELPAVTSDGTEFQMELSLSAGIHEKGRFVMAIMRDITQRQLMEEALRESELRYRYVFENVGEGIVILSAMPDGDMICTMANPAAEHLVGVDPGMLHGRSYRELFDQEAFAKVEQELAIRKTGAAGKYDVVIKRQDGSSRKVVITAKPRFDDQDRFIGSFCLLWDAGDPVE